MMYTLLLWFVNGAVAAICGTVFVLWALTFDHADLFAFAISLAVFMPIAIPFEVGISYFIAYCLGFVIFCIAVYALFCKLSVEPEPESEPESEPIRCTWEEFFRSVDQNLPLPVFPTVEEDVAVEESVTVEESVAVEKNRISALRYFSFRYLWNEAPSL